MGAGLLRDRGIGCEARRRLLAGAVRLLELEAEDAIRRAIANAGANAAASALVRAGLQTLGRERAS